MFPKIVHSTAKSEKSKPARTRAAGDGGVGACAASLCLWLLGPFVVQIVYPPEYVSADAGDPAVVCGRDGAAGAGERAGQRSAGARNSFSVVPLMVVLAMAYGFALRSFMLNHFPPLEIVLQTLGVFNLLLFASARGSSGRQRKMRDGKLQDHVHGFFCRRGQRLGRAQFFVNPGFQRTQRPQPACKTANKSAGSAPRTRNIVNDERHSARLSSRPCPSIPSALPECEAGALQRVEQIDVERHVGDAQ